MTACYNLIKHSKGRYAVSLVNDPHDLFFKETMGDLETARDFLTHYLPSAILKNEAWKRVWKKVKKKWQ